MNLRATATALALVCLPTAVWADGARLELPAFEHLDRRATESVNISLGAWLLGAASWLMDDDAPDDAEVKKLLQGLTAVNVRSYQFDSDFVYSPQDIEAVRNQLQAPQWSQLVQVRDRKEQSSVDVYVSIENERTTGFTIVASEPREFTIVNLVGSIEMKDLAAIERHFGLATLERDNRSAVRTD